MSAHYDPIRVEVIRNELESLVDEMWIAAPQDRPFAVDQDRRFHHSAV
jgi:hypothetical protein